MIYEISEGLGGKIIPGRLDAHSHYWTKGLRQGRLLDAFLDKGDTVAGGVLCARRKPGSRFPTPCGSRRRSSGASRCYQLASLKTEEARQVHACARRGPRRHGLRAAIRARRISTTIPRHGMIQFHPVIAAALPGPQFHQLAHHPRRLRAPGSASSGPPTASTRARSCCRRKHAIGPDDTLGSVYFDRLFPMGVAALQEAADLVVNRGAVEQGRKTNRSASYEGWCRDAEARDQLAQPSSIWSTT